MLQPFVQCTGSQDDRGNYPITLGSGDDPDRPCALQDAIGTFNDATFPTYADANSDGFPDDPDPAIKLIIEDGGRPTYSTTYLTNYQPLKPASTGKTADGKSVEQPALPNPRRQPEGLLMTGNMPTRNVKGGANKTSGAIDIAPHAGDDVLVSAQGAGAANFSGFYENTAVATRLARALGAGAPGTTPAPADGRTFVARLFVAPRRQVQYLELDYSRAVPPGDDDDY